MRRERRERKEEGIDDEEGVDEDEEGIEGGEEEGIDGDDEEAMDAECDGEGMRERAASEAGGGGRVRGRRQGRRSRAEGRNIRMRNE